MAQGAVMATEVARVVEGTEAEQYVSIFKLSLGWPLTTNVPGSDYYPIEIN